MKFINIKDVFPFILGHNFKLLYHRCPKEDVFPVILGHNFTLNYCIIDALKMYFPLSLVITCIKLLYHRRPKDVYPFILGQNFALNDCIIDDPEAVVKAEKFIDIHTNETYILQNHFHTLYILVVEVFD